MSDPYQEEQPLIDYLERPVYDEDDLYDGRMDLGYDDDE